MVGVIAALGLGAGACGSGTTAGSSGTTMSGTPMPTPTGPAGPAHLTTKQGLAVYVFASDTNGKSHCYGQCAVNWPPVPAGTGLESAGTPVSSMLGSTTRTDGGKQLTLDGHPLYRYIGDHSSGQINGQGLNLSGGLWWLVAPNGSAMMTGASSGPSSGGGYGSGGGY